MTRIILIVVALMCAGVAIAAAQRAMPMIPYSQPAGPMTGLGGPMIPGSSPGGAPVGCDGTINLASGCAQPMLGGL